MNYTFDPCLDEEERHFYSKAYPTLDVVRDRRVHCTVCKCHIGTAPIQDNSIKMHPILRVTHCLKCHDFYNSGEFSKGEDGSELYCRWCGQGGEVYCCYSCPYVFCKSCIVKNLSRGVVADIEQNENWSCFRCAPKILWPLRAQHWALVAYIKQQKEELMKMKLTDLELKQQMNTDRSKCCRFSKIKGGNVSDSVESIDSAVSKRSTHSKRKITTTPLTASPPLHSASTNKRIRSNDELVCTPDLMSMLEPDCQITVSQKSTSRSSSLTSTNSTSKNNATRGNFSINNIATSQKKNFPPIRVLRNSNIKLKSAMQGTEIPSIATGQRNQNANAISVNTNANRNSNTNLTKKVYYTISGYRVELNAAAMQPTYRLPNGKLIQVKRRTSPISNAGGFASTTAQSNIRPQGGSQSIATKGNQPPQITSMPLRNSTTRQTNQQVPQVPNNCNNWIGPATVTQNGGPAQMVNGEIQGDPSRQGNSSIIRHVFPETTIGQARSQLQEQIFSAMDICRHLTNKIQNLANSNAYKQARNYFEIKELYIHLSYLMTYANGRFKDMQDKCLDDMRQLGFGNDADCLENGQLAAGVDYVCYGQLEDVDLFNTGANSFHNQVYEYRKSLNDNLSNREDNQNNASKSYLPNELSVENLSVDVSGNNAGSKDDKNNSVNILNGIEDNHLGEIIDGGFRGHWMEGGDSPSVQIHNEDNDEVEDHLDNDNDNEEEDRYSFVGSGNNFTAAQGTEDSMRRTEESHAYDRKLTRLVSQYPSIWCTQHPDYGNFDVTRKQWRTIAAHFKRGENIKLRWKNIRKRFVRIEKRLAQGKRFNGHFDKALSFLSNRDLPEDEWLPVDCGDSDGDTYDRQALDAIEHSLTKHEDDDCEILINNRSPMFQESIGNQQKAASTARKPKFYEPTIRPIDIKAVDLRIINFVKANTMLWQKSQKSGINKEEENLQESLWTQLQDSMPKYTAEEIKDRWQQLYEMYKVFRFKIIKSAEDHAMLEFKYSKYLAKLYFLYKIDEEVMRKENPITFEDSLETEDNDKVKIQSDTIKLQDMPDDKEFLHKLVNLIRQYPAIWDTQHIDYNNITIRNNYWQEIHNQLENFKRDIRAIKLRWQLAKFSYLRWKSEKSPERQSTKIEYYSKNLPKDEMTFLN